MQLFEYSKKHWRGTSLDKNPPSNARGAGSIPGWGAKIPHASWPKYQNIKQKQYCNKFNKDFKNGPHQKKIFKKCWRVYIKLVNCTVRKYILITLLKNVKWSRHVLHWSGMTMLSALIKLTGQSPNLSATSGHEVTTAIRHLIFNHRPMLPCMLSNAYLWERCHKEPYCSYRLSMENFHTRVEGKVSNILGKLHNHYELRDRRL